MKFAVLVSVLLVLAVSHVQSVPHSIEDVEIMQQENSNSIRAKRSFSCDTLSFLGDTACTTSCFFRGKKSGTCIAEVCVCKVESVSDVVDLVKGD